ncbi:hypothetical protein SLA2020_467130 [Shorea laevis]
MARLIRPLRRILSSPCPKSIILYQHQNPTAISNTTSQFARNYISEMRKSALEDNILRLLRNEIQYELERSPPKQPVTKFNSFTVDDRPGEQWIRMQRKFRDKEDIRIEATMFDGSIPASKSDGTEDDVELHISLIVNISKEDDGDVLEITCSAWPDSIEIINLFIRRHKRTKRKPFIGPEFKELDDELQDSLYEFLEERGIDDNLAVFLHEYMKNKDKTEFSSWLENVKSFIGKK